MIADHVIIIDAGVIKANDTPSNLANNMRAAGKITLEVRGAEPEIIGSAIQRLEQVKKVMQVATEASSPWLEFEILCDSGTDTRERIANLANQYDWSIRTLHRHRATLEDVFVEMTRKD
jgi:ABC-2 type transport system ATP-binding protein